VGDSLKEPRSMDHVSSVTRPTTTPYSGCDRPAPVRASTPAIARGKDQAQISTAAQMLSRLSQLPEVRQDLVDQIRGQIADGTYDVESKIDAILDDIGADLA